jgi:hypothetical protein
MHGVAYRAVTRQHPFNRIQQVFGETGFEQDFVGPGRGRRAMECDHNPAGGHDHW